MVDGLQSGFGVEGNRDAGEIFEMGEPAGIEREAEVRKWLQGGGIFGIVRGEHACGGRRSLSERNARLEDGDACSAAMEFEGEREANDAGPGNTDVGLLHKKILDGYE
jgi:hypothetical protein